MSLGAAGLVSGLLLLVFYIVSSWVLQLTYYSGSTEPTSVVRWKVQPRRIETMPASSALWWIPRLPLLSLLRLPVQGAPRPTLHAVVATVNLLLAAMFAAATVELIVQGYSAIVLTEGAPTLSRVATEACALLVIHQLEEYVWHRVMHAGPCYRACHKLHHVNTAPAPFDDMVIHPLEAAGYYTIMWSSPFLAHALSFSCAAGATALGYARAAAQCDVWPQLLPGVGSLHVASFCAYIGVLGVAGIVDHSGVRLSLRMHGVPLYDAADHDAHHEYFNVNYGFPTMWMDMLCGTFRGRIRGLTWDGRGNAWPIEWRGGICSGGGAEATLAGPIAATGSAAYSAKRSRRAVATNSAPGARPSRSRSMSSGRRPDAVRESSRVARLRDVAVGGVAVHARRHRRA